MVTIAYGDATLESLLVGIGIGLGGALLALLPLTLSGAEWLAFLQRILAHGDMIIVSATAITVLTIGYKLGIVKLRQVAAKRRNLSVLAAPARFPNGWYWLADSDSLHIGDTRHILAMGKDVALFRGRGGDKKKQTAGAAAAAATDAADGGAACVPPSSSGHVFVLDAVCPHLGANMALGGKVVGNDLECPFHGWQFSGESGTCSHIPYLDPVKGRIPSNAKTDKWTVQELNGGIFMHYDVDRQEPRWHVPSLPLAAAGAVSAQLVPADFAPPSTASSTPAASSSSSPLRFHGLIRVDVAGSAHELISKHADVWAKTTPAGAAASSTQLQSPSIWRSLIGLQWARDALDYTSPKKSVWALGDGDTPSASLDAGAVSLTLAQGLLSLPFDTRLLHVGSSLLYVTMTPRSSIARALIGEIVLLHAVRPDTPFIAAVEMSAYSRRIPSPDSSSSLLLSLLFLFCLPLQRFVSRLLLRLWSSRFRAHVLPVYDLGRIKPLSLHNAKQDDAEQQQHADAAADLPQPPHTADNSVSALTSCYRSDSPFTSRFLSRFYSDSGVRKVDDMSW